MTRGLARMLRLPSLAIALALLGGCNLVGAAVSTAVSVGAVKLQFRCIPEGTLVDTPAGPRPIESLRPGERVVGFDGGTVRILQKHGYAEDPDADFLAIVFEGGERVDLCGMHRIAGVRAGDLVPGDAIAGRVVARTISYRGVARSYDLLTEDAGYRIGGVPVNSMIEEMYAAGRAGGATPGE